MTTDPDRPAGTPLGAVRSTSRGPSPGVVGLGLVAALIGAVAVSLVGGPGPPPSPVPIAVASASPDVRASSVAVGLPAPPSSILAPTASATVHVARTIVVLRGVADPADALGSLLGCAAVNRDTGPQLTPGIRAADVDRVAEAAGRESGWVFVPPGIQASSRVWLGTDVVELANAVGQQVVVVSREGDVWLGSRAGATRWIPIATPMGRTAWVMASDSIAGRGACREWPVPGSIAGERSLTCAGLGVLACLSALEAARTGVGDLLSAGGDATVSASECLMASQDCRRSMRFVLATPEDWPTRTRGLRIAQEGRGGQWVELAGDGLLPPEVLLGLLARPSLPLLVGDATPPPGGCGYALRGVVRGSPWDPRVVWIGDMAVVWPKGTAAWFTPELTLELPGVPRAYAGAGATVEVHGDFGESAGAFVACSASLIIEHAPPSAQPASSPGDVPATTPGAPSGRGTGG